MPADDTAWSVDQWVVTCLLAKHLNIFLLLYYLWLVSQMGMFKEAQFADPTYMNKKDLNPLIADHTFSSNASDINCLTF